jgi:hypothetical protein
LESVCHLAISRQPSAISLTPVVLRADT